MNFNLDRELSRMQRELKQKQGHKKKKIVKFVLPTD